MQTSCCSSARACTDCVWEDFSEPLKRFVRKRVSNEQDTEDIIQGIFIKIHNNIGSIMHDDKIHAWIYLN